MATSIVALLSVHPGEAEVSASGLCAARSVAAHRRPRSNAAALSYCTWIAAAYFAIFGAASRAAETQDEAVEEQPAGEKTAATTATVPGDDAQDLLFLGPMRPVLIRLHVKVNRQPFRQLWRRNIEKLFDEADANRDGAIDLVAPNPAAEGQTAPKAAEIDVLAKNAAVYLGQEAEQAKLALRQFAVESGGQLNRKTLVEYFSRVAPPLAVVANNGPLRYAGAGMAPAPALFPLLDVDGDQQLTAEELAAAESRLANRDFNEDEVLSPRELSVAPDASLAAATPIANEANAILPGVAPLFLIGPDTTPELIVAAIVERYDHDRDGSLAAAASGNEIAFPEAQTAQFDLDGDGRLTSDELLAFARGGPGVELTAMIGKGLYVSPSQRKKLVQIHASAGKGVEAKLSRNGAFKLTLSDASLDLYLSQSDPAQTADNGPTLQNFDADNNGYLDADELAGNADLEAAFEAIDVDGDGKIFGAEFNAYAQRQARAASSRLLLEVADGGQQLLNVLDSAADNVLSVRELRGAAAALDKADANGDGRLAGNEIPQRLAMQLSRNTAAGAQTAGARPLADDPERREAAAGPAWFRKLDRNRDGDLSRREFVGPAEVFQRLDADGDGLISAAEAEQARP